MNFMMYSLVLLITSGLCAVCLNRFVRLSNYIGAFGVVFACIFGLCSLFIAYIHPESTVISFPWAVPYGSFSVDLDSLGILFLFPIYLVSALSAIYGIEYMRHYFGKKNVGITWFFYNLLVASIIVIVISRNAILFLLAWELMSISSFFLVMFEGEKKAVIKAGLIYLIATNIGTLFLLAMFIMLGKCNGSFDFAQWKTTAPGITSSIIFIFAVIGFGTKAGFMPLHIWLPEAHPAAPSHVSAVMSAIMIKTGIYGLVRILTFLGTPSVWWGCLLIFIGVFSGVFGILFALAQHDLKRLLAYSSIENIGIISIGIGLGTLGISIDNPVLTVMGFAGGLLHVVNHAFFKGLLFLGAGVVLHETGTREIDVLGGLLKKMPFAGICFFIAAAAICGLPPLNGFISEFLIYSGSFKSIHAGSASTVILLLVVIMSLSLIGGLAIVCFTKAFGIIFLGEPRSEYSKNAHEQGMYMKVSMGILAGACVITVFISPYIMIMLRKILSDITEIPSDLITVTISDAVNSLFYIVVSIIIFYGIVLVIAIIRKQFLKGRIIDSSPTWDCGYARPTPRMQYTASSFVQPVVDFFKGILGTQKDDLKLTEYFPYSSSFKTKTADIFHESLFRPLHNFIYSLAGKFTLFQHGRLQVYILYILFTLVVLLIWKL